MGIFGGGSKPAPAPIIQPIAPPAPKPEDAKKARKRPDQKSSVTGPLGISGEANTATKTLLGA